jgi:hypothetical protein
MPPIPKFPDPILHSLLTNEGTLATRLQTASQQLGAMFAAGELDALDVDARLQLRGLQMFLVGAAGDALEGGV